MIKMAFPERNLNQTAVYWGSPINNGSGGFTWDTPVELDCRWAGSTKIIMSPIGEQIVCRAEVHVKQDIDEQGMLYLGELDDLSTGEKADPTTIDAAYLIKRFDKIPTIKGNKYFRKAFL